MTTPPHDLNVERIILATCIEFGADAVGEVKHAISEPQGLFYDLVNALVWTKIEELLKQCKPINAITIQTEKREHLAFIENLMSSVLPIEAMKAYLPEAIALMQKRMMWNVALTIKGGLEEKPADELMTEAEKLIFKARNVQRLQHTLKSQLGEVVDDLEWSQAHQGEYAGVPSGLGGLDNMLWGFRRGDLNIIGGRPSQGKTSLCTQIAIHVALRLKIPVLIFSLESSAKHLLMRMLAQNIEIDSTRMRRGTLSGSELASVTVGISQISKAGIFIEDDGSQTISQMRSTARRRVQNDGVGLIVLDYVQKAKSDVRREKRTYEIGDVTEGLKDMAKELNAPVLAAAQLNREMEKGGQKEGPRPPRISDLGDSGMIERDADVIMLLERKDSPNAYMSNFALHVPKNRDGECGRIFLTFYRRLTLFKTQTQEEKQNDTTYTD